MNEKTFINYHNSILNIEKNVLKSSIDNLMTARKEIIDSVFNSKSPQYFYILDNLKSKNTNILLSHSNDLLKVSDGFFLDQLKYYQVEEHIVSDLLSGKNIEMINNIFNIEPNYISFLRSNIQLELTNIIDVNKRKMEIMSKLFDMNVPSSIFNKSSVYLQTDISKKIWSATNSNLNYKYIQTSKQFPGKTF